MVKHWRAVLLLLLCGLLGIAGAGLRARAAQTNPPSAATSEIHGDRAPYHLEWNGREGWFSQDALGVDAARKVPLVFLHSDPGPKGYAKYTAWFLARDGAAFSLLWCYLNDSGTEFYCWLYRYPINQLTSIRFTGSYRFTAPSEPVPPMPDPDLKPIDLPHYSGPDFVYGNWTRRMGTLAQLQLHPTRTATFAVPLTDGAAGNTDSGMVKTLTNLRAYPLHEINVPDGNGWRASGWRELHALAYDGNDPYYLILYSHTTRGFVIDLRRAETYETDYGRRVVFSQAPTTFGNGEEQVTGPPELQVQRYTRHELTFTATGSAANPYNEVYLDVQFHAPNGKVITVPGFWDGGVTWHARISPTIVGKWTWTTTSSDPGMHRQEGSFSCISSPGESKGFVAASTTPGYRHDFVTSDGTPFLPVFVSYPVHHFPAATGADKTASAPSERPAAGIEGGVAPFQRYDDRLDLDRIRHAELPGLSEPQAALVGLVQHDPGSERRLARAAVPAPEDAFTRFQHEVDALAQLGFNRFIGEYLIDPVQFAARTQSNEGGAPFVGYNADRLNPAYFQAMDQRIAYANERGIVPDIGIGELSSDLYSLVDDAQIKRLWRYLLARYAAYNVCWMPFGRPIGKPLPVGSDVLIEAIQKSTLRYDPVRHPLTMMIPGGVEAAPKRVRSADTGNGGASVAASTDAELGHAGEVTPPAAVPDFVRIPELTPAGRVATAVTAEQAPTQTPAPPVSHADAARQAETERQSGRGRGSRGVRTRDVVGTGASDANRATLPGGAPPPSDPGEVERERRGADRGSRGQQPTGFIESPAGLPLGPTTAAAGPAAPQVVLDPIPSWMDVIVFNGGPLAEISAVTNQNRPVVIYDRSSPSDSAAIRHRLWATLMSGGYWAGDFASVSGVLDRPETRWTAYSGRLLEKTRFWRLAPHNEMVGGGEESEFERRRRHQAQAAAEREAAARDSARGADASDDRPGGDLKPMPGPIYVLADPGWEYVVYFERGGTLTLDLLEATGKVAYTWFNPRTGEFSNSDTVMGGAFRSFRAPDDNDWTLYISRR